MRIDPKYLKYRKHYALQSIYASISIFILTLILNDNCSDTGCGLKVFDKNCFLNIPFFDGIHRFLPSLFIGFGHKVKYMSVSHRPRLGGFSNYGTLDRLFIGIRDTIKVRNIIINKNK